MKWLAFVLLTLCIYDIIRPALSIFGAMRQSAMTWDRLIKYKAFHKYIFAIFVNATAIVFFVIYLNE